MPGPASTSSNTRASSTVPQQRQPAVNTQTKVLDAIQGRILCIADIRGHLSQLNRLAAEANVKAIVHTGDFGFCDNTSLDRINDRTLRHLIMYSPLITVPHRNRILAPENSPEAIRSMIQNSQFPLISEFPKLLTGEIKLNIPVYTVYGACEDVAVLEKFRAGQYNVENLHVLDEATTRCIDVGGVKLRLLGLGGALVAHKLWDNGDGQATLAGGQGTMWTTALQIGELVDTAQRVYDPSETRVLVSHASPGREGILAQLALTVKADLTLSAGLHFRYPISYNEFSVQADFEAFRSKLLSGKESFERIWEAVKPQVEAVLDDNQKLLLEKALSVVERIPSAVTTGGNNSDENAWKNCWNWNLTDAAYGQLILDIREGRVNAELKSQGFNYAYRRQAAAAPVPAVGGTSTPIPQEPSGNPIGTAKLPTPNPPSKTGTPGPPSKAPTPAPPAISAPAPATQRVLSPVPPTAPIPKPAAPAPSGSPAPTPQANGSGDKELSKKEKKKQKEKEKKDAAKAAVAASNTGANGSGTATPADNTNNKGEQQKKSNGLAPPPSVVADGPVPEPTSPVAETASGGSQTPLGRRGSRNPWTLFVKHLPIPVSEEEIRDYFGEAAPGIIHIKIPIQGPGKTQRHIAYVEFGDEEAMRAGLAKRGEKIRDSAPHVSVAEDREGGGSGRGGRGGRGGLAARGLAAAGLGRHAGQRKGPDETQG